MSKYSNPLINIAALLLILTVLNVTATPKTTEKQFVITIIDTGIDMKNAELVKALWTNPGESGLDKNGKSKSTNRIDDDGNGFVDDVHGWNFFENSNNLQDNHGHGTHIAGIILNELKKLKIEKHFRFQILKYFDSETNSLGLLKASNLSIQYAVDNHTQLINYSGGGYEASKDEENLMRLLHLKNIPLIAAIGNQKLNTDVNPFYPASYNFDTIFAIGAAERSQSAANFSNYGKKRVDFLAPGVQIESFGLNGTRSFLSGTSQSTATATALVAYLAFQEKGPIQWTELKQTMKNLRQLSLAQKQKGNPQFLDVPFINKYKTSAVDAFGEP